AGFVGLDGFERWIGPVQAGGNKQAIVPVHLEAVGAAAGLPVENQFPAVRLHGAVRFNSKRHSLRAPPMVLLLLSATKRCLSPGETIMPLGRSTPVPVIRCTFPGASMR